MKRLLITLLVIVLAVPLVLGGFLYFTYGSIDESVVPDTTVTVMGETVSADSYEWHAPVLGGLIFKDLYSTSGGKTKDCGTLDEGAEFTLSAPEGYESVASLLLGDSAVWTGKAEDIGQYTFLDSGQYTLTLSCEKFPDKGKPYGVFSYNATFVAVAGPRVEASADGVVQGDVLAVRLYNLPQDVQPTLETELGGGIPFVQSETPGNLDELGIKTMTAYVPVAYDRAPGDYAVSVRAGDQRWDIPCTVVEGEFTRQDLTIDVWDPVISEANSWWAYEQFNTTVPPLYGVGDAMCYWSGAFTRPHDGKINTEFGLFRYTNGSPDAERHAGIDIDGETGNPVLAPNNGKVLFAQYLLNTGNTLIIDHGGGLKSYFYHMDTLSVAEGAMVQKGDTVGTLGTTGYSTGPHLHYEVRIGDQAIDPTLLFEGTGGLYYYK